MRRVYNRWIVPFLLISNGRKNTVNWLVHSTWHSDKRFGCPAKNTRYSITLGTRSHHYSPIICFTKWIKISTPINQKACYSLLFPRTTINFSILRIFFKFLLRRKSVPFKIQFITRLYGDMRITVASSLASTVRGVWSGVMQRNASVINSRGCNLPHLGPPVVHPTGKLQNTAGSTCRNRASLS